MKIYEIIFYGDSPKKNPFICEIKNEAECERFQQGISYKNEEDIEIKIIQQELTFMRLSCQSQGSEEGVISYENR